MGRPPNPLPGISTSIRLPDGREFPIKELLKQVSKPTNINIKKPAAPVRSYSTNERFWIAEANIADIKRKYSLQSLQAKNLKQYSQFVVKQIQDDEVDRIRPK